MSPSTDSYRIVSSNAAVYGSTQTRFTRISSVFVRCGPLIFLLPLHSNLILICAACSSSRRLPHSRNSIDLLNYLLVRTNCCTCQMNHTALSLPFCLCCDVSNWDQLRFSHIFVQNIDFRLCPSPPAFAALQQSMASFGTSIFHNHRYKHNFIA